MERPNSKGSDNFVVGIFVAVALVVSIGFVVFMGGSSFFSGEQKIKAMFRDVRGLNVGAPVFLSGIQIGRVTAREFPTGKLFDQNPNGIVVVCSIFSGFMERVKIDSTAEITTQGVLGDKVVVISRGSANLGSVQDEGVIQAKEAPEFGEYLTKGGNALEDLSVVVANLKLLIKDLRESGRLPQIIENMDVMSKNLAQSSRELPKNLGPALERLNSILTKVDRGEGTLGALVNDATLHEDLRILLGGAKRSKAVRFLLRQAISANDETEREQNKKSRKDQ